MILDAAFLIDLMNGDTLALSKLQRLLKTHEPQFVAAPTIFELYSGLARCTDQDKEQAKIKNILADQLILPLGTLEAEKAGKIHGSLKKEGRPIQAIDSMIAGIASHKKEKVVTRNVKDFSKVKGIDVEMY
ncbi:PIN domain-containing protein [Candidatus Woesearchaeota archaeon]|nr:PIN domain-containing protein [Candidatus Woesearchaeota archaeon]